METSFMNFNKALSYKLVIAIGLAFVIAARGSGQATAPPLTLPQAIQLGLVHHPMVESAQADFERSAAKVSQARASLLPTISASEDIVLSDDPVFAFGTKLRQGRFASSDFDLSNLDHPSPIGNFSSSATASWLAFDSGATQKRLQSARSASQAVTLTRQYTEQEVAIIITKLYYRVLLAEAQVSVAQQNLARAQEIVGDIRDRVHSGLALDADGMRADLSARNSQDDLSSARAGVQVARRDLFDAIGQSSADTTLLPPVDGSELTTQPAPTGDAFSTRLDIQSLDMQQKSAQQNLASVRATAGPQLSSFGHIEADNPHLVGGGSYNWTVGATLEIRVFDGGARKAQEQDARAQLAKLAAQKEETLRSARSDVATLQAQIEDLHHRCVTSADSIQVNQEALQTARDRYAAGLLSVSEVLNAEADLSAAEFAEIRIFYELCIAEADLKLATGTSLTTKAGQP
jgi:outer membrane protein